MRPNVRRSPCDVNPIRSCCAVGRSVSRAYGAAPLSPSTLDAATEWRSPCVKRAHHAEKKRQPRLSPAAKAAEKPREPRLPRQQGWVAPKRPGTSGARRPPSTFWFRSRSTREDELRSREAREREWIAPPHRMPRGGAGWKIREASLHGSSTRDGSNSGSLKGRTTPIHYNIQKANRSINE